MGEQYSLLILLFYVPNGLCDLPLNMMTKRWSGRIMLPACKNASLEGKTCQGQTDIFWRSDAWLGFMCPVAVRGQEFCWDAGAAVTPGVSQILYWEHHLTSLTRNHSAFEAGFFAGAVFYLTLFYTRGELGFRIAIFFGSALLAAAFSGLISFGVFQIQHVSIHGWMWLFLIEG